MANLTCRTLVVSAPQDRGWGAEEVLEHLLREGVEVCVACPQDARFPEIMAETGQPWLALDKGRDSFFPNVRSAWRLDVPGSITHVHSWCTRSVEAAYVLSRRLGVPLSVGLHDSPTQDYHGGMRSRLIHFVTKRAVGVATVSKEMAAQSRELGLCEDPAVIYNGIPDVSVPLPRREVGAGPVVGFLGMNAPRKGFSELAHWIGATDCHWRLYGDVALENEALLARVRSQYGDRISVCGRQPSDRIYREIDIVVMPTLKFEPFGLVAVEAGRANLPVVASAAGGPEEIIVHEKTGYLYPCGEREAGLAYLQALIKNPAMRSEMGRAGRQRFLDKFLARRMAREWTTFFNRIATS